MTGQAKKCLDPFQLLDPEEKKITFSLLSFYVVNKKKPDANVRLLLMEARKRLHLICRNTEHGRDNSSPASLVKSHA
jgi:hypothetical protein